METSPEQDHSDNEARVKIAATDLGFGTLNEPEIHSPDSSFTPFSDKLLHSLAVEKEAATMNKQNFGDSATEAFSSGLFPGNPNEEVLSAAHPIAQFAGNLAKQAAIIMATAMRT